MEFPKITVGGGFAGTAGESSSFKHGLFDQTIHRIEIVLADGEVVEASKDHRPDLLHAAAGSFGTFGVITMLEIQLVEAKQYVELTYSRVDSMEEAITGIELLTEDTSIDYLEGIMFGLNTGVIISGRRTDGPDSSLLCTRYTRAQDPWFCLRAEDILGEEDDDFRELVPLKDYIFRYDRGTFWGGKYAFEYFLTPLNAFTRWLLDGFMRTDVMYHALHKSHIADECIVQDIAFPYTTTEQFVKYVHRALGFYPLWLCPLKMEEDISLRPRNIAVFAPNARSPGMMINVGLWGPGPRQYDKFIEMNRDIERKTAELGGLKCFYAQAFYTEAEFWNLYDKQWYDAVRSKYKASELPTVYEKVNVDLSKRVHTRDQNWQAWAYEKFKEQWPIRGVYGVLQTFLGREYLLAK